MKTFEEVITEIAPKYGEDGTAIINRFNKANFIKLVTAAANDPDFVAKVAVIKGDELADTEEIAVGTAFRKWVRKIVEQVGVDTKESAIVEEKDFTIPNMEWAYTFFAEVLWQYLQGNRFEFLKKDNFNASIALKDVPETITTGEVKKPGTGEILGNYETKKKSHKELVVKGKCPKWLQERRKL